MLFDRSGSDRNPKSRASGPPLPDAVRGQLEKTLSSKTFESSPQLCRFLRFLVDQEIAGRGAELKEFVLAMEVFGKGDSFDPRVDTVVRTEARRLRQKLMEYYQSEGRGDAIEIILPKGCYRAVFQPPRPEVSSPSRSSTVPHRSSRWIATAIGISLLAAGGYWLWARRQPAGRVRLPSIAVIPLESLSADPEQEHFADGMTDALVTDLAKIQALSVISRTSMLQYKKTKKRVLEIGRELKADYVVEGTVTRAGDRIRITAQLIAAPSDRHLWADSFERSGRDILGMQGEIAQAIANHVHIRITPQEHARLGERPVSFEAWDLYSRGRSEWQTREMDRLYKSVDYFKQAIAREQRYARAFAGLADSYFAIESRTDRQDFLALGCEASKKAVELDANLGEAHATLSSCADDWAWSERERHYRRSLELSPGYATGHAWYGGLLIATGRFEAGLAEIRHAVELDPLAPAIRGALGWALYITRRYDDAIAQNRRTLEIFPNSVEAHLHLGLAYTAKRMHPDAIAILEKAMKLTAGGPPVATLLAHAHARAGNIRPARRLLEDFEKREGIAPILFGLLYMDTGDKDRAFEWFDRAVERRSRFSDELKVEPMYEPLRSDPRWALLLRKMNLTN
ncbi:MAG: tetratricopeptide repeat protein [Acidobacteria bacterium]|nr:tetratricopeptide repeat protein [Acidobacteriota bacterium]